MTNILNNNAISDINDIFDDILLSEEKLTETGYQEGYVEGHNLGNAEGFHLGYHRGAELGTELGFYYGVVVYHLNESTKHSEKTLKLLENLKKLIDDFPRTNDENLDIFQLADDIRKNYKKVCTFLKISSKYLFADDLTF